jgi:hypothetical protein
MSHLKSLRSNPGAVAAACCAAGVFLAGMLAAAPCGAASVPAWLDDAISKWNAANPGTQIRFVDIKDSFVWYDIPKRADLGSQQIRERVNSIVLGNGYEPLDDEELVTTGKPPVSSGRSSAKKCWSRSFVLNISAQSGTTSGGDSTGQRQRMLTSLVCDDDATWWAAFRVAG